MSGYYSTSTPPYGLLCKASGTNLVSCPVLSAPSVNTYMKTSSTLSVYRLGGRRCRGSYWPQHPIHLRGNLWTVRHIPKIYLIGLTRVINSPRARIPTQAPTALYSMRCTLDDRHGGGIFSRLLLFLMMSHSMRTRHRLAASWDRPLPHTPRIRQPCLEYRPTLGLNPDIELK